MEHKKLRQEWWFPEVKSKREEKGDEEDGSLSLIARLLSDG